MVVRITFFVIAALSLRAQMLVAEEDAAGTPSSTAAVTTLDPTVSLEDLRVMVRPLTVGELQVEADAWFQLLRAKARQIAVSRLGVRQTKAAVGDDAEAQETLDNITQTQQKADIRAAEAEQALSQAAEQELGIENRQEVAASEQDGETDEPSNEPASDEPSLPAAEAAKQVRGDLLDKVTALQGERSALSDRLLIVLDSLEAKGGDPNPMRMYAAAVNKVELEPTDVDVVLKESVDWLTAEDGGRRWAWNFVRFGVILLIAYLLARILGSFVNWLLERKVAMSRLAEQMIANTIKYVVLLVGFAIALTALEIDITPILAAMGAAGLVIGLALQDSLSNVASGLMVLVNRPFDVGDVVNAGGVLGSVQQMNLVSTTLRTFDNQTIHIPNNEVWNNVITNVTANETRRVDLEFGIGYSDNFEDAEQILRAVVDDHPLVLGDPEPTIAVHALADSSVNIVCRPWAKTSDWWQVKTEITREVKRRFDAAGISIPFPQRDVHVHYALPNGEDNRSI